jgi:phage shock protein A
MAGIFARLRNLISAEANSAIDKMEDPAMMAEEALRQLNGSLGEAKRHLVEAKTNLNQLRAKEIEESRRAADLGARMELVRQRFQAGEMQEAQARDLVAKAMAAKNASDAEAVGLKTAADAQQAVVDRVQAKIQELQMLITQAETKRRSLAVRSQAADAEGKINTVLSGMDSSGAVAMLARMEDKVQRKEARAQALSDMTSLDGDVGSQLDRALYAGGGATSSDAMNFLTGGAQKPALPASGAANDFLAIPSQSSQNV